MFSILHRSFYLNKSNSIKNNFHRRIRKNVGPFVKWWSPMSIQQTCSKTQSITEWITVPCSYVSGEASGLYFYLAVLDKIIWYFWPPFEMFTSKWKPFICSLQFYWEGSTPNKIDFQKWISSIFNLKNPKFRTHLAFLILPTSARKVSRLNRKSLYNVYIFHRSNETKR